MSNFRERQKSLFDHLKDAEDLHSFSKTNKINTQTHQEYGVIDRKTYRKVKQEMRQFRGKESIFKKPEANIRECLRAKSVPDYMKNPQKWVYYSLSDVTPEQMSDKTNTATALAFIREMEETQANKTDTNMEIDSENVVFKKPKYHISSKLKPKDEKETITIKNNKILMPEYVVGVSKKNQKKGLNTRTSHSSTEETSKKNNLKLDHLYGDNVEED